ncbi:MAG: PT domain-containing protein [Chloroflexi bacterium]|nr:PT domain-containing protein [Chloroflexota bacterium]
MKRFLLSLIILPILILAACAPATIKPSETPSPSPTDAPTTTPSASPTPLKAYSEEQLFQMADDEKLSKAPQIEDLVKSNVSTVRNNLVIYRNITGDAIKVYDLTIGKELTLQETGIIELALKDGGSFEMLSFQTAEDLIVYAINDGVVWKNGNDSDRVSYWNQYFFRNFNPTDQEKDVCETVNNILGISVLSFRNVTLPKQKNVSERQIFLGYF